MSSPKYIRLKDRPPDELPRERLLRHGADKLASAELLSTLVRIGTKGRSAVQVAQDLLDAQEEGVSAVARMSPAELARIKGIGKAKAAAIAAAFELGRRAASQRPQKHEVLLETVEDVADYFRRRYGAEAPEKFVAFYINKRHRLLHEKEVARGSGNAVVVDPREVFREALLCEAKGIILAHNHPAGSLTPSKHDHALTERLLEVGKIFSVPIVEHVIVTEDSEAGLLG